MEIKVSESKHVTNTKTFIGASEILHITGYTNVAIDALLKSVPKENINHPNGVKLTITLEYQLKEFSNDGLGVQIPC